MYKMTENLTLANQYFPDDAETVAMAARKSGLNYYTIQPGGTYVVPKLLSEGNTEVTVAEGMVGIVVEEGNSQQSASFWRLRSRR